MCKVVQNRSCRLLTAAVALLWCAAVGAAEGTAAKAQNSDVARARLGEFKPVSSDLNTDINTTYRRDMQKAFADQDLKMAEAVRLVENKNYSQGVKLAENVRDELKLQADSVKGEVVASRLAEAEALVARLRIAWGREQLRKANAAFLKGQTSDAMILAAEAARISAALRGEAEDVRKRSLAAERQDKFQKMTSYTAANPNLANLRKEAATLIAEAKVFFENKRYDQALDKIEQVYLRDPFNLEAVALAGQIYREFFTKGYYRHRSDFEVQAAYTTWQWIEPVFEAPVAPKPITVQEKGDRRKAMSDKLNTSILPQFTYAKGDASGAVSRLRNLAKDFDIDIQDTTNPDDVASLGSVTLNLNNVSVGDVLRYISLMSGLKYRVEENGVRVGTSIETLYNRSYEIQPHVINMVYANTSSSSGSSSGGDDSGTNSSIFRKSGSSDNKGTSEKRLERDKEMDTEMKLAEIADIKVTSENFKEYLMKHGIKFGEDSSISYLEHTHTLEVKNTIENLDAISQLIRDQNALQAPLILVEIKCIEISDNDMEELGFDWSLGETSLNKNMNNDGTLKDSSKGGWMLGPGIDTRKNEKGERGAMNPIRTGFMDGSSSVPLINNLNIFPMLFGSNTPFGSEVPLNISLTVNALSQNTRTEVVSAPKVVALSGVSASAKMTKSYYFPDEWSDLEVETDTSDNDTTYTIQRPTPEFGDEQEIGIDMRVVPTMTETGTINLKLDFEVTGTNGNDEFTFILNGNVNGRPVSHSFTIWKPVITERKIVTDIDVYEGQTVVVGGSTDNRTVTRNDKIPFLGELPLIGRLFQAQSEKAERRNMLVFVTARRLGTDGAAVVSHNQGAPDFNR